MDFVRVRGARRSLGSPDPPAHILPRTKGHQDELCSASALRWKDPRPAASSLQLPSLPCSAPTKRRLPFRHAGSCRAGHRVGGEATVENPRRPLCWTVASRSGGLHSTPAVDGRGLRCHTFAFIDVGAGPFITSVHCPKQPEIGAYEPSPQNPSSDQQKAAKSPARA